MRGRYAQFCSSSPVDMKIGKIEIHTEKETLVLNKSKTSKLLSFFFIILFGLAFLLVFVIFFFRAKGRDLVYDFDVDLGLFVLLGLSIFVLVYGSKRVRTKYRPFILRQFNDDVLVNEQRICSINELEPIKIQRMTDRDGASSYNIGLSFRRQFYPLCLEQSRDEAVSIASIVAHFFGKEVKMED